MLNPGEEASNAEEDLKKFKARISKQADDFLHQNFPKKILQLDELLNSDLFAGTPESMHYDLNIPVPGTSCGGVAARSSGSPPPAKRRRSSAAQVAATASSQEVVGSDVPPSSSQRQDGGVAQLVGGVSQPIILLPSGESPSNRHIVAIIDRIKPLIKELVEQTNLMKMWILFLIPKIEDGNNFGVAVQEDALTEVRSVENEAAGYVDGINRYFMFRAKTITKVAKYPQVADYRRAIQELDEKEYLHLKLIVAELRNNYSSLHDLIIKNIDKIKKPRNANAMENMF